MKKTAITLLGACASIGFATAGEVSSKHVAYIEPAPAEPLFAINPYALYGHTFGSVNNADGWGAGISMLAPVTGAFAFEGGYEWRHGDIRDLHTVYAYGRYNVETGSAVTPYVFAGPSFTWGFPIVGGGSADAWGVDGGLGLSVDIAPSVSAYVDYRYRWDVQDKLDDQGIARLGLSIRF